MGLVPKAFADKFKNNDAVILSMTENLQAIYSNKSSDEYKQHGDITLSSQYNNIELMVGSLSLVKMLSKSEIDDLKQLFNTLHRPIFKKMVTEYLAEPNTRNIIFTATYTVGYRSLIGELSRIFSSTKATEKGFIYKPDMVSRKNDMGKFIKVYNKDLEKRLDEEIRRANIKTKPGAKNVNNAPVQEGAMADALAQLAGTVVNIVPAVFNVFTSVFRTAKELNPIALMSSLLSRSYDKKVSKFNTVCAEYEATKKAYDEYMKLPQSQRKQRIEHRYTKMMDKYNIKMQNLKAQIDHFDSRSIEETKDQIKANTGKSIGSSSNTSSSSDNKPGSDEEIDF